MNLHNLKCWPAPFQAIVAGDKRADFRRDDRGGFQVGDVVRFMEWAPLLPPPVALPLCYTGATQLAEITHVQPGGAFGIPEGFAILSFVLLVRPPLSANPLPAEAPQTPENTPPATPPADLSANDRLPTPLPCPFCGSEPEVNGFGVECPMCRASMPALHHWNRRSAGPR